jgi:hypothetical protein
LDESYEAIKERACDVLGKNLEYPNLYGFNDAERSVTYSTEKLIPTASTNRPRVMLLFSNPHPYSVHQGMFLSPNINGRESLFWPVMKDAGWFAYPDELRDPDDKADYFLEAKYQGLFELIFYCYYAFPTNYPDHIQKIFGREFFNQVIEPEAKSEFRKTLLDTDVEAVVTFNKGIFNLVSKDHLDSYIKRLIGGDLIQSKIKGIDSTTQIFLTYPTGWRYHKQYRELRKSSLERIKISILKQTSIQ